MQISHIVCQGANIKMMLFLRKSAGLNSEVSAPKSHLRAKMIIMSFYSANKFLDNLTC